jgi:hypothetical protein
MILWFLPINTVKYSAILAGQVKLTGKQMYKKSAHPPPIPAPFHPAQGIECHYPRFHATRLPGHPLPDCRTPRLIPPPLPNPCFLLSLTLLRKYFCQPCPNLLRDHNVSSIVSVNPASYLFFSCAGFVYTNSFFFKNIPLPQKKHPQKNFFCTDKEISILC